MTPEEKNLLEKSVELEKENNILLRSIKRSLHISSIMTAVYWVFIIGSAIGAFWLIKPYVEVFTNAYGGAKSGFSTGFNNIMNSFNHSSTTKY